LSDVSDFKIKGNPKVHIRLPDQISICGAICIFNEEPKTKGNPKVPIRLPDQISICVQYAYLMKSLCDRAYKFSVLPKDV